MSSQTNRPGENLNQLPKVNKLIKYLLNKIHQN